MCRRQRYNALLLARSHIANGREVFICYALRSVAWCRRDLAEAATELRAEIEASLDGSRSLSHWLGRQIRGKSVRTLPMPYSDIEMGQAGDLMYMARLAWLDRLIEQEVQ